MTKNNKYFCLKTMTKSSIAAKINDVTHRPSGHLQTHTYAWCLPEGTRGQGVPYINQEQRSKRDRTPLYSQCQILSSCAILSSASTTFSGLHVIEWIISAPSSNDSNYH